MKQQNESGFTLPEVIIVLFMSGMIMGLVMYFTISYWRYGAMQEADLDTFITRLNAGDLIREQVGTSSGLINQNSIQDSNTHSPDPTQVSGKFWSILHATPGTKSIGSNGTFTPLLYFRRYSVNTTNAYIMNGAVPYEDEYVLYLNGSTKQLLLRTIANSSAVGNKAKTSCPASKVSQACPADKIVASDVASVATRYFSRNGNLIDYTSIVDTNTGQYAGPDMTSVEVVEFTLNITKKPIFQTTSSTINSTVIRVALRNT